MLQSKERERLQHLKLNKKSSEKQFAAKISVISNTTLTILKIIVGIFTGSISILSEAIHSGIDLAASIIAYFSIRIAEAPADSDHPYGHGKYEDISGFAEAILIFLAAVIIVHEAYTRLIKPELIELTTDLGILVMLISTITNIVVSSYLFKVAKKYDSLALFADAKHLQTDVITSFGVFVALIIIKFTGQAWIDPAIAIAVAALISFMAIKITYKSVNNLVDVALPPEDENRIKEILSKYEAEIISIHSFCSRKGGNIRFVEFHLTVQADLSIKQGHLLCDLIEEDLKNEFPNINVLIHLEPCTDNCDTCHVYYQSPESCRVVQKQNINKLIDKCDILRDPNK